MALFKKKDPKALLNDDNVIPEVLAVLNNHRESVKRLSAISEKFVHCKSDDEHDMLFEQQTKIYDELTTQEKFIKKFGYALVIESHDPFAWALNETDYKAYLSMRKI
ncbi:MAG: hypothetical protein Ta2G_19600 [Termitinemataceae bacterium]|nr:MAG: hypothetical protein Ta2G_19600 [Termitinemataceae bacterium]